MLRNRAELDDPLARYMFRHPNSAYTSCSVFIMFKKIEMVAACKMQSVIHFLNAKNGKLAEYYYEICNIWRIRNNRLHGTEMCSTLIRIIFIMIKGASDSLC